MSTQDKRWLIFDDKYSLLHSLLGVIVRIGASRNLICKVASVIALVAFIMYELIEVEDEVMTLGDLVETLIGYVLADIALEVM